MGEVYRAKDTHLGRTVALKLLPARFASEPERLHRFQQEARAASALNHPNIITVYDAGVADGAVLRKNSTRLVKNSICMKFKYICQITTEMKHSPIAGRNKTLHHMEIAS